MVIPASHLIKLWNSAIFGSFGFFSSLSIYSILPYFDTLRYIEFTPGMHSLSMTNYSIDEMPMLRKTKKKKKGKEKNKEWDRQRYVFFPHSFIKPCLCFYAFSAGELRNSVALWAILTGNVATAAKDCRHSFIHLISSDYLAHVVST